MRNQFFRFIAFGFIFVGGFSGAIQSRDVAEFVRITLLDQSRSTGPSLGGGTKYQIPAGFLKDLANRVALSVLSAPSSRYKVAVKIGEKTFLVQSQGACESYLEKLESSISRTLTEEEVQVLIPVIAEELGEELVSQPKIIVFTEGDSDVSNSALYRQSLGGNDVP